MYNENETMFMLGQNCSFGLVGKGGIAEKDFTDVLEVHRRYGTEYCSVALDFFMLGYIYGKREERSRKRG